MTPILHVVWVWGGLAAAIVTGLAAFLRGGTPEKWGAAVFLTSWFVSPLIDTSHGFRYGLFASDVLTMIGYLVVAMRWRRVWAFGATVSQLLAVVTHLIVWYVAGVRSYAYITLADIFGADLPMVFLIFGVLTAKHPPRS